MMNVRLGLILASFCSVLGALPAAADPTPTLPLVRGRSQNHSGLPPSQGGTKGGEIPRLRDQARPATTLKDWRAQIEAATVQITNISLTRTETGLDITLETAEGKPLQVDATKFRREGNSLIADIPNAVLALPQGQTFTADNPTADIATVQVIQQDTGSIRVSVAGNGALPKTEVTLKTGGLAYSLNPEGEEPDEEIVVTGEREGYRVPNSSVGTRTNTPLRDIPQSIRVIPQEVLRDQNVNNLNEALRNATGVVNSTSPDNFVNTGFTIRGFGTSSRSGGSFLRNGLREGGEILSDFTPNIERIEVLLGPASVLYGNAAPGGTINTVTKQPLRDPSYAVDATIGSYNFYQGAIDLSGPLNDSKTVLYRLNVGYQSRRSFIDFFESSTFSISPVVSFAIGERTRLTFEGEYIDKSTVSYSGLPIVGTILPNPNGRIPLNRFTSEPDGVFDNRLTRVSSRLEHQFSDNWSLQNAFSARIQRTGSGEDGFYVNVTQALANDNRTMTRQAESHNLNLDDYDLTTNLIGRFSTGEIDHQLLFGIDLGSSFLAFERFRTVRTTLDVFNPIYGNVTGPSISAFDGDQLTRTLGIYVQDQVTLAENLKLLLSGRFDWFEQDFRFLSNTTSGSGNAFSPRLGIVYQPIDPISLYASYSRSFFPVLGTAFGNDPFEPQRGTQYEVGIKADLNNRLSTTIAFYDLTRSNVLTADLNNPGFSIQTGEQRSRGAELSIAGEISPGWKIIAGYAYTDARITKDNRLPVGNRLSNVPENAFNFWTSYEIQQGTLQGLGLGLGLFYVGERQGDLGNSFQLPSYLRTDAAIFYNRGRFRAALNFRNLFNVEYFESTNFPNLVLPGSPFMVQGTISWQF
jgi:iron complex outermembrane receptor protein